MSSGFRTEYWFVDDKFHGDSSVLLDAIPPGKRKGTLTHPFSGFSYTVTHSKDHPNLYQLVWKKDSNLN